MKTNEYTREELNNIRTMFDDRKLFTLRDKSDEQSFENEDLCLLRFKQRETVYNEFYHDYEYNKTVTYTMIVSIDFIEQFSNHREYHIIRRDGVRTVIGDYTSGFAIYHLNIPRELYETEWKKFQQTEKAKQLAKEEAERERLRIQQEAEAKKREEELLRQKQYEEAAERNRQIEEARRSQLMTITVGQWEDVLERLAELSSRLDYVEDNMCYRYRSEEE